MFIQLKRLIAKIFVAVLGSPINFVLQILAKSQLSNSTLLRIIGWLPLLFINWIVGLQALRFIGHISRREKHHHRRPRIHSMRLLSYLYLAMNKSNKSEVSALTPKVFRDALIKENLDPSSQYDLAHQLFNAGKLSFASEVFQYLADFKIDTFSLRRRLQLLRDCGIALFLQGSINQANGYWRRAGELRRFILGEESGPIYRVLGDSWFIAIGHVAMLDFYSKYNKLYRDPNSRFVSVFDISKAPGGYLFERFGEVGLDFIEKDKLQVDYDKWARKYRKRKWSQLTADEHFALVDDFWEFEFPDGQILGYTHAANKIQKAWEGAHYPPLLKVTKGEENFINSALRYLGLPDGAWYVCLHVREPGFHKGWNTLYPSMRDANIEDYMQAIELIVKSGGWVIRMGDSSMKPLPPMDHVIDYAHSSLKTPKADILISARCRFFLGTNSGFATIPHIFGVRCVFSNWLPLGLPLWSSQDLMLPKLFWNNNNNRYLTFNEMFSSGLAFIQNLSELPESISLRDNTPEDIIAITSEALGINSNSFENNEISLQQDYEVIALKHGSYCGCKLATHFFNRYEYLVR